jgi:hypothetical protein
MNRRGFISLLAGTAGTGLVLWRIPRPVIILPGQVQAARLLTSANARFTLSIPDVFSRLIVLEAFEVGDIFDPKIATGAMLDEWARIDASKWYYPLKPLLASS